MSRLTDIRNGTADIDFVGPRRRWFALSAIVILVSLGSLGLRNGLGDLGLNLSIDFLGGSSVQADNPNGLSIADVQDALSPLGLGELRVEELGDGTEFRIRTESLDDEQRTEMLAEVASVLDVDPNSLDFRSVGPTFGAQIARRALLALGVFLSVVMLFIAWRFEWRMALGAIGALFHDLIITAGVYSVTGLEVTPSTVVAILTILGYSLYDTVVVYDKIREVEELDADLEYDAIINKSMNLVLVRSLFTSITSLVPVGSMLFVGSVLLGAGTLTDFALALFVGIAAGTYSSIFIAAPIVAAMRLRVPAKPKTTPTDRPPEQGVPRGTSNAPRSVAGGSFDSRRPISSAGSPRPPKKRKK